GKWTPPPTGNFVKPRVHTWVKRSETQSPVPWRLMVSQAVDRSYELVLSHASLQGQRRRFAHSRKLFLCRCATLGADIACAARAGAASLRYGGRYPNASRPEPHEHVGHSCLFECFSVAPSRRKLSGFIENTTKMLTRPVFRPDPLGCCCEISSFSRPRDVGGNALSLIQERSTRRVRTRGRCAVNHSLEPGRTLA